jgi:type IV pilus assembly protein PilP
MKRAALIAVASAALVAGCGPSSHKDLIDWMNEQGKGMRGHLDPIPTIKPYEPFVYNDFDLPDPFKPRKIEPQKSENTNKLAPDLNRRKEPLEAYPLESLSMVGTLEKGRTRYALIKTPERDLYQVRQGMHMGQNYGVITDVTDTDIKLKELMQDGSGDWSERSSTLNLLQADQKTQERRK